MGGYEYEKISRMYVVGWCIDPLSIRYLLNDIYDRYPKASYYWMKEFLETKGANLED